MPNKELPPSVVCNWRVMDWPQRISVAMGLISAASLPIIYGFVLPQFGVAPSLYDLVLSVVYLPLALFVVPPVLGLVGATILLIRPITTEQRGIIGFTVFIASVPGILVILGYAVYLWTPS